MSEFILMYIAQKAMKYQALADFVADHPCMDLANYADEINTIMIKSWTLTFDGSRTNESIGAG